jgi:hypothetical protein
MPRKQTRSRENGVDQRKKHHLRCSCKVNHSLLRLVLLESIRILVQKIRLQILTALLGIAVPLSCPKGRPADIIYTPQRLI